MMNFDPFSKKHRFILIVTLFFALFSLVDEVYATQIPPFPTIGEQKLLVILVNTDNSPSPKEPMTRDQVRNIIFDGEFQNYYQSESQGKIYFTGDVVGWYTIPVTPGTSCGLTWGELTTNQEKFDNLIRSVREDVDLSQYRKLMIVSHHNCTAGGFAGIDQSYTLDGVQYSFGLAWVGMPTTIFPTSIAVHELSHTFGGGLWHADALECGMSKINEMQWNSLFYATNYSGVTPCYSYEYGNFTDIMGGGGLSNLNSIHFNAAIRDFLGWFDGDELLNVERSGVYTINPLEKQGGEIKSVRIRTSVMGPREYYYLEYHTDITAGRYSYWDEASQEVRLTNDEVSSNNDGIFINWMPQRGKWCSICFIPTSEGSGEIFLLDMSPLQGIKAADPNWHTDWLFPTLLKQSDWGTENRSVEKFIDNNRGVVIGPVLSNDDNGITFRVELLYPSGLVTIPVSSNQINLTWFDNQDDETRFEVERSANGTSGWANIVINLSANTQSYSDSALNADTTYHYRVRSCNNNSCSLYSNIAFAKTLAANAQPPSAPPVPTNLSAAAASISQINLSWTDVSSEDNYKIERSADGTAFTSITNAVSANVITYSDTGLDANAKYYYRLSACNAGGCSTPSSVANATTLSPPPVAPPAPSNFSAAAASVSQINLAWIDNSNNETKFEIDRSPDGTSFTKLVTDPSANITSFSDTALSSNTTYYYRIRACNGTACSAYSSSASAKTLVIVVSPPSAPSGLVVTTISNSKTYLSWTDNSNNELTFVVERSSVGASSGFSAVATTQTNVNSLTDTNLAANTIYYYKVKACHATDCSSYSSAVSATTGSVAGCLPAGVQIGVNKSGLQKVISTGIQLVPKSIDSLQIFFQLPQSLISGNSIEVHKDSSAPTTIQKC
ncbi:MAG: fibronectin type III domain-containing protein [Patescibacteria group bacterium]